MAQYAVRTLRQSRLTWIREPRMTHRRGQTTKRSSSDFALNWPRPTRLVSAGPSRSSFSRLLAAFLRVGGFLSAAAAFKVEEASLKSNSLQTEWLEEHQGKLQALQETLAEIQRRFETLGPTIDERIQSEEYLGLVRKAFRVWDESDTEEKRRYTANVVTNSAGTRVCSDDVIRLFIDWLELYHEAHFAVIREIFQNPGSTRFDIWSGIYSDPTRRFRGGQPLQNAYTGSQHRWRDSPDSRHQ